MQKKNLWQQYKMPILLLGGIAIGAFIGVLAPNFGTKLKVIGDIFLNLMFTIVVPLVFVSIASAVGAMVNMKRLGKILGGTIAAFLATGAIAGVCVLVWVNHKKSTVLPGESVKANAAPFWQKFSDLNMVLPTGSLCWDCLGSHKNKHVFGACSPKVCTRRASSANLALLSVSMQEKVRCTEAVPKMLLKPFEHRNHAFTACIFYGKCKLKTTRAM